MSMKIIHLFSLLVFMLVYLCVARNVQAATVYSYDLLNRLKSVTYPDGTFISYTYDAAGNLTGSARTVIPAQSVTGVCGIAHGTVSDTVPIANFCSAGKASSVIGGGPWSWACQGSNGGQTVGCTASINYYSLSLTIAGSGKGTVVRTPAGSNPSGVSCTTGVCSSTFPFGSEVSYNATADAVSVFDHWTGNCVPSGPVCVTTISNSAQSVTATFASAPRAAIGLNTYETLSAAYNVTQSGNEYTILALFTQDYLSSESIALNRGSNVTIKGGYKVGFQEKYGLQTAVKSPFIINNGRLTVEDVVIITVP